MQQALEIFLNAINNRQKRMGYNAAMEFTEQMSKFFANKDD